MARLVCTYPSDRHDEKLARITEVVRNVTEGTACEPERRLHAARRMVVTVRGLSDTQAIQGKLTLADDGVDPQVYPD